MLLRTNLRGQLLRSTAHTAHSEWLFTGLCTYYSRFFIIILERTVSTYKNKFATKLYVTLLQQQPHTPGVYDVSRLHHFFSSLIYSPVVCTATCCTGSEPRRAASYTTSVCGSAPHDVGTRTGWPNDAFSDRIRPQGARDRWGSPHCPFLHARLPPSAQMAPLSENLSQSFRQNWGRLPRGTQCAVFTPSLAATMLTASCAEPSEGSNDSPLMFLDGNTENSFLMFEK